MRDAYRFNFESETWKRVEYPAGFSNDPVIPFGRPHQHQCCDPTIPKPTYGHSMVVASKTHALIFGGTEGQDYDNTVFAVNLESFVWTILKCSGDIPSPRYMARCFVLPANSSSPSKRLLVLGGDEHLPDPVSPSQVHELNLSTLVWKRIPISNDPDTPRSRLGTAIAELDNGEFILFGGRSKKMSEPLTHLMMGDQSNETFFYSSRRQTFVRCKLPPPPPRD